MRSDKSFEIKSKPAAQLADVEHQKVRLRNIVAGCADGFLEVAVGIKFVRVSCHDAVLIGGDERQIVGIIHNHVVKFFRIRNADRRDKSARIQSQSPGARNIHFALEQNHVFHKPAVRILYILINDRVRACQVLIVPAVFGQHELAVFAVLIVSAVSDRAVNVIDERIERIKTAQGPPRIRDSHIFRHGAVPVARTKKDGCFIRARKIVAIRTIVVRDAAAINCLLDNIQVRIVRIGHVNDGAAV